MELAFYRQFSKKFLISNLIKILLVGAELFHADKQTDRQTDRRMDGHDEANIRCSLFCERA